MAVLLNKAIKLLSRKGTYNVVLITHIDIFTAQCLQYYFYETLTICLILFFADFKCIGAAKNYF